MSALVHENLAVVGQHDAGALERARRGSFEIHPRQPETAAVSRALELDFSSQVVGRAAKMRAGADEDVKHAHMLFDLLDGSNEPDPELFLPAFVHTDSVLI